MDTNQTNRQKLLWLFENKRINIKQSGLFFTKPGRLPDNFDFERVEGMMLGLAIGDSPGNTSEGMFPRQRHEFYDEIRGYLPNRKVKSGVGKSERGLWVDTALSAMLTHNDSASISACLAAIHLIWRLLQMEAPPAPYWWIDEYVKITGELEIDNSYSPCGGIFKECREPLWRPSRCKGNSAVLAGRTFRLDNRPG